MARIDDFLQDVRAQCVGAPDPLLRRAIQRAAAKFLRLTHAWSKTIEVPFEAGEVAVDLDQEAEATVLQVKGAAQDGRDVGVAAPDILRRMRNGWAGTVTCVALDDGANKLMLYPSPSIAGSLAIEAVLVSARDASTVPDFLLDDWYEAIVAGAVSSMKLTAAPDMPWHDMQGAEVATAIFNEGAFEARRRAYAGGTSPRVARPTQRWL